MVTETALARTGLCESELQDGGTLLGCLQAALANLNTMCNSQAEAFSLGAAVGAAVQHAIPSSFGPNPCALFQGAALVLSALTQVTVSNSNSKIPLVQVWQLLSLELHFNCSKFKCLVNRH